MLWLLFANAKLLQEVRSTIEYIKKDQHRIWGHYHEILTQYYENRSECVGVG